MQQRLLGEHFQCTKSSCRYSIFTQDAVVSCGTIGASCVTSKAQPHWKPLLGHCDPSCIIVVGPRMSFDVLPGNHIMTCAN